MSDKEKDIDEGIDFSEEGFKRQFKRIERPKFLDKMKEKGWREIRREDRPAITLKSENKKWKTHAWLNQGVIKAYWKNREKCAMKSWEIVNKSRLALDTIEKFVSI